MPTKSWMAAWTASRHSCSNFHIFSWCYLFVINIIRYHIGEHWAGYHFCHHHHHQECFTDRLPSTILNGGQLCTWRTKKGRIFLIFHNQNFVCFRKIKIKKEDKSRQQEERVPFIDFSALRSRTVFREVMLNTSSGKEEQKLKKCNFNWVSKYLDEGCDFDGELFLRRASFALAPTHLFWNF